MTHKVTWRDKNKETKINKQTQGEKKTLMEIELKRVRQTKIGREMEREIDENRKGV